MQFNKDLSQFDQKLRVLIEEYVQQQDLHALETPLKSEKQIKNEFREKLLKQYSFSSVYKSFVNAIKLINAQLSELNDEKQTGKVKDELEHAFKTLSEIFRKRLEHEDVDWMNQWDPNTPVWAALYGISTETLLMIYEMVLTCYQNQEIENAKDLLQILLIFAPTVPAYWNALGFCFQAEGNFDQALNYYLTAEEIDEDQIETHFYLARCYAALNKKPLAQEQIDKLFKLIGASKEIKEQWENSVERLADEIS